MAIMCFRVPKMRFTVAGLRERLSRAFKLSAVPSGQVREPTLSKELFEQSDSISLVFEATLVYFGKFLIAIREFFNCGRTTTRTQMETALGNLSLPYGKCILCVIF